MTQTNTPAQAPAPSKPAAPAKDFPGNHGVPGHTKIPEAATKRVYTVEDPNCARFGKTKTHSIPVMVRGKKTTKEFIFKPNERVSMSQEEAITFLETGGGFIVRNAKGDTIRPRNAANPKDRMVLVRPHEIVVPLTHVLKVHLLEIAQQLPGCPWTNVESVGREVIEEFIITGGKLPEDEDEEDTAV